MKKRPLPKEVIDNWPEIFGDIDVKAIPLEYLYSMNILFKDGKRWELNIASHVKNHDISGLDSQLKEFIGTYEDSIEHIDLRLDVNRVKKDITKKTRSFLKNKKRKT